jgi:hypothetical protein
MRLVGHVTYIGVKRMNSYLVGKPEGKRPLGRARCRWVYNITMNFRETGGDGTDWIDVAYGKVQWRTPVNVIMSL